MQSEVLLRFLSGLSPASEAERVREWAASDPANAAELERLRRAWELTAAYDRPVGSTKAVWQRIAEQLPETPAPARPLRVIALPESHHPRRRLLLIAMAAAATIVVAIVVFTIRGTTPVREVATKRGEREQLRLADGTRIVLGPATTLKIAGRDVYLDGQGYFEVAHDSAHPFTVHTARGDARALGTRFSVRAYPDDREVQVVVTDGVVGFGDARLRPGDVGSLDRAGHTRVAHSHSLDATLDWTRGVLHLDDIALGDAIPQLERQYDLVIHVATPALNQRRITATFTDQNLSEVLSGLAFLVDAQVHIDGRVVTIIRKED
jgi:transmembrane sensor